MKLVLLLMCLMVVAGCGQKTHYWYLKHGERAVIFIPGETSGKMVTMEVEAPEYKGD